MYCPINEAWDNKNSLETLSKRYEEHFNSNELNSYIINDSSNNTNNPEKSSVFLSRKDARFNNPSDTIYNKYIEKDSETDIKTEDILLKTDEIVNANNNNLANNYNKAVNNLDNMSCNELIEKVLNCPTCRLVLESKLNVNNGFNINALLNNETKEILILILLGLVIIIIIDILLRIVK
tara:strand:+ start:26 stop:562 length:537 start_codon:yes stop_codon:yes gene_type:complete